ncbi:MAG: hypothetical protein K2X47_20340 [Bdellovibrionales bacterium]|nr:hypothetical protein [Bdellovibrionales bacterium]
MKAVGLILVLLSWASVASADFSIGYVTDWADYSGGWNNLTLQSETDTGSQLTNVFHFFDYGPWSSDGQSAVTVFSPVNPGAMSDSNHTGQTQNNPSNFSTYGMGALISSYTNADGSGYNDVYRGVGQQAAFREEYYTDSSGQGVQRNIVDGSSTCYRYGTADVIPCD